MVSNMTIAAFGLSLLLSVGLPVACVVYFAVKKQFSFKAMGIGAAVFILFALLLETLVHQLVLVVNPTTAAFFKQPVAYGVYGGLMAGIFEETGRFIAFLLILKALRNWRGGIGYGFGHGGIEAVLLGGLSACSNLVTSVMINSGALDKSISALKGNAAAEQLTAAKNALIGMTPTLAAMSGIERVFALLIQIGLTFIVLYAVKNRKYIFFIAAILIHALIDFPAALYQKGVGSIWLVEGVALLAAVVSVVWVVKGKRLFLDESPAAELPPEQV